MKMALIQLPDGLKPKFEDFIKKYEEKGYSVLIWAGSNFGACDIPILPKNMDNLLLVNVGHNNFPPKVQK